MTALKLKISGHSQGIGLRPKVFQCARIHRISGLVRNVGSGVEIEASGLSEDLNRFQDALKKLLRDISPHAHIEIGAGEKHFSGEFVIAPSISSRLGPLHLPVDLGPCDACRKEFHDATSRRFGYWFISCTECGPRYSLMEKAPFDREHSSYRHFEMCSDCRSEYSDPQNRRFHAQFISCHECGPKLSTLITHDGRTESCALGAVLDKINQDGIALVKSFSGYYFLCRADRQAAVERLRHVKNRPDKSFGLVFQNIEQIQHHCAVSDYDIRFIAQQARPMLIVDQRASSAGSMSAWIAPGLKTYGAMLPPNMILESVAMSCPSPLVVTSANLKFEPIAFEDSKTLTTLMPRVDAVLMHNLDIINPADDSVFASSTAGIMAVRLGRGFTPLSFDLTKRQTTPQPAMAQGAFDKITLSYLDQTQLLTSPHFGDAMSSAVRHRIDNYTQRFLRPETDLNILVDAHPDAPIEWLEASQHQQQVGRVFHHRAHAAAAIHDLNMNAPCIVATLDGTGYGPDQSSWGGEFWRFDGLQRLELIAQLRPIPLIGGEAAIRDVGGIAVALVEASLASTEARKIYRLMNLDQDWLNLQTKMLHLRLNIVRSHGMGRLFDGIGALLGCSQRPSYDGQVPMELEALADRNETGSYSFPCEPNGPILSLDWRPVLSAICHDILQDIPRPIIAARFHNSVVEVCLDICRRFAVNDLVITGGVALNRRLIDGLHHSSQIGLHLMKTLPPNDGSISTGQLLAGDFQWVDHVNEGIH